MQIAVIIVIYFQKSCNLDASCCFQGYSTAQYSKIQGQG